MNFYSDETYGERVAGVYDEWYSSVDPHAIDLLAALAGNGRALELGIGTGRVALPLADKNVNVSGIDAAQSMIDRLKAKPVRNASAFTLAASLTFPLMANLIGLRCF
jgi:ubiquinone/menaquinone biosynthesis C-methylase UbiE